MRQPIRAFAMGNERGSGPSISLIVPCWKEYSSAIKLAKEWSRFPAVREVIIAGVEDEASREISILEESAIRWCMANEPGRGTQMNAGALAASGDILLFHRADSYLAKYHSASLSQSMADSRYVGGAFHRKFDQRHPQLLRLENLERLHSRLFGTLYGDQSIFVRREIFFRMSGFSPIPLMEDVELSGRLRQSGPVILLDPPMGSSPSRHLRLGAWGTTLGKRFTFTALPMRSFSCTFTPTLLFHYFARGKNLGT